MFSKGELEIQETIIVLFVFVVIAMIGFVMFFRYSEARISSENQEFVMNRDKIMSVVFPNNAEIGCSVGGDRGGKPIACVDALKMLKFGKLERELGNKVMKVMRVYPKESGVVFENGEARGQIACTENNIGRCNSWVLHDGRAEGMTMSFSMKTPVLIYEPVSGSYGVGVFVLEEWVSNE